MPIYQECKINGSICNKIFRRKIFQNYQFHDGILHEDAMLLADISECFYRIHLSDKGCYRYNIRSNSRNTLPRSFKWYSDLIDMESCYYEKCKRYASLGDIGLKIYMQMTNSLRMATHSLSRSEISILVQQVESHHPSLLGTLRLMVDSPLQGLKMLFSLFFGLNTLIKLLPK